jgi:outer membrane protein OmpA-like peptidoglycan-associated protein
MKLTAKCSNFNGCLLAYRSEDILLAPDAPLICPECEKVLSLIEPEPPRRHSRTLPLAAAGILAAAAGATPFLWKKTLQPVLPPIESVAPAPTAAATPPSSPGSSLPAPAELPAPKERPALATIAPPPAPVSLPQAVEPPTQPAPEPAPAQALLSKPADQRDPVTEKCRTLLLEKADTLKSLSLESRESLIASLEATRKISKLATVPVQFGIQKLPPTSIPLLKPAVDSTEVRALLEKSPSPVYVVLGYADGSGDTSKNLTASQSRSDLVAAVLREKLPRKTPVYSIAMGSSHLPAPDKPDENRVAEVWLISP